MTRLLSLLALLALGCTGKGDAEPPPDLDDSGDTEDTGDTDDTAARDADEDGYAADDDCDDADPLVNPAADEVCDRIDNDCDGRVDDEDDSLDASGGGRFFEDRDGDGHAGPGDGVQACVQPEGTHAEADDCDDADDTVHPDAVEICDGRDNDCDTLLDDADDSLDATTATTWYPDTDGDGYGSVGASVSACAGPAGHVDDATDCDDGRADVHPGATEICDAADTDEDCDGVADDADGTLGSSDLIRYYPDADGDGYGDATSEGSLSCDPPPGAVDDASDCDDAAPRVNPGAVETCDSIDNDCDGVIADGTLGSASGCAGLSCLDVLLDDSASPSGMYWLDPDGDGADAAALYCDMTSADGGWTLIAWTGDSTESPYGVPYPGLATCPDHDCLRGSAADTDFLNALLEVSGEIGLGHSTVAIDAYQGLADYDYAGYYDYGSLSGLYLDPGTDSAVACDPTGFATGTFHAVAGPTEYEGTTVYVAQSFRYTSGYGGYDEAEAYIWNIGADSYCGGSGAAPGAWLGNWGGDGTEPEYGPYLRSTAGARAVWLR